MSKMFVSGYFCRGCYLYYKDEVGTKREMGNVALTKKTILCSQCKARLCEKGDSGEKAEEVSKQPASV